MQWVRDLAKMNVNVEIRKVLERKEVQDVIIAMNTRVQLYELGENSLGVKLSAIGGDYSPYTKEIKMAKGQPIDRVTLRDTGEFYASFVVKVLPNGDFEITANPIKDEDNLFERWGNEVTGLQPKNLAKILDYVEAEIINKLLLDVAQFTPSQVAIV